MRPAARTYNSCKTGKTPHAARIRQPIQFLIRQLTVLVYNMFATTSKQDGLFFANAQDQQHPEVGKNPEERYDALRDLQQRLDKIDDEGRERTFDAPKLMKNAFGDQMKECVCFNEKCLWRSNEGMCMFHRKNERYIVMHS